MEEAATDSVTLTFTFPEVSAIFTSTTSITYTFKELYVLSRNSSRGSSFIYSDMTLRGENISLGFRTRQSPALLLSINSFYREYLVLLLNQHGENKHSWLFM